QLRVGFAEFGSHISGHVSFFFCSIRIGAASHIVGGFGLIVFTIRFGLTFLAPLGDFAFLLALFHFVAIFARVRDFIRSLRRVLMLGDIATDQVRAARPGDFGFSSISSFVVFLVLIDSNSHVYLLNNLMNL